jgi:hypothetical protein
MLPDTMARLHALKGFLLAVAGGVDARTLKVDRAVENLDNAMHAIRSLAAFLPPAPDEPTFPGD